MKKDDFDIQYLGKQHWMSGNVQQHCFRFTLRENGESHTMSLQELIWFESFHDYLEIALDCCEGLPLELSIREKIALLQLLE